MLVIKLLRKLVYRHFKQMNWQAVLISLCIYTALCWLLLSQAGESALTGSDFFYWLLVTASTVGYGDLSPTTPAGKAIVAFFVIPFGLSLFALTAGKVAAFGAYQWRKGIMGYKDHNLQDHILIIGWDPERTPNLLQMLRLEASNNRNRSICLCVTDEMENPMPGDIDFVRCSAYNNEDDLNRACIATTSSIIIDTSQDDQTLTAALYTYGKVKDRDDIHVIAFLRDESLRQLLKEHCPTIECTPSVSAEIMVKAAMDPGSSVLHRELLMAEEGMTQYSTVYPEGLPEISVRDLYIPLKEHYDAMLIAVDLDMDGKPEVNPTLDKRVRAGSTLYYIAARRIHHFDWAQLASR
ncbi:potassium channel protein [Marinobacterium jannaschii]|uniref:potassium channel protein n=1 Tax=Marinobacterium jannaschii TaxID=64970 RepID=UPI00048530EF|nr:potassium channel family protein [Marinobacterium jannaschii]